MTISITELRANIYNVVDTIIETGEPVEIERHGIKLRIITVDTQLSLKKDKLSRLIPRKDIMVGDPNDYVHIDWSHEWKP